MLYGGFKEKPREERKKRAKQEKEVKKPTRQSKRIEQKFSDILISCPMCDATFQTLSDEVSNHIITHM